MDYTDLKNLDNKTKRKILHILAGAVFLLFLFFLGRTKLAALLFVLLLGGLLIINLLLLGLRFRITDWFIINFERQDAKFPGYTTAWYVAGLLIATTVLHSEGEIASVICALAFGDGLSTIVGAYGKIKLFYNNGKTLEGVAAFFLATLPTVLVVGPIGIVFAFASAIFESIELGIDDNFSLPIFGTIFFSLL